jgi:hypothetical protein
MYPPLLSLNLPIPLNMHMVISLQHANLIIGDLDTIIAFKLAQVLSHKRNTGHLSQPYGRGCEGEDRRGGKGKRTQSP